MGQHKLNSEKTLLLIYSSYDMPATLVCFNGTKAKSGASSFFISIRANGLGDQACSG